MCVYVRGRLLGTPGEERGQQLVSADIPGDTLPMAQPHTLVRQPEGVMASDLIPPTPAEFALHLFGLNSCISSQESPAVRAGPVFSFDLWATRWR